jgi:hypothetical protein
MNILSIKQGKVSMSLGDLNVSIGGVIYNNLVLIARLLTYDEVIRLDSFDSTNPLANALIEDDVFDLVFERILGFPDDVEIDKDEIEAGIISTVTYAIITRSIEHVTSADALLEQYESELNAIDTMQAVVSRYMCTPFQDIVDLPINELFKRFALVKKTYPHEITRTDPGEQVDE